MKKLKNTLTTRLILSLALIAVCAGFVVACSKSESESKSPASGINKAMSDAKNAMDTASVEIGKQAENYKPQIDSLKASAANFKDDQLNTAVKAVQDKYNDIMAKVTAAKGGDKSAIDSLKADGSKWVSDLKGLYDKAMARVNELKASAPK
jgi:hypothetical protein